jgi:hypothetical protein
MRLTTAGLSSRTNPHPTQRQPFRRRENKEKGSCTRAHTCSFCKDAEHALCDLAFLNAHKAFLPEALISQLELKSASSSK